MIFSFHLLSWSKNFEIICLNFERWVQKFMQMRHLFKLPPFAWKSTESWVLFLIFLCVCFGHGCCYFYRVIFNLKYTLQIWYYKFDQITSRLIQIPSFQSYWSKFIAFLNCPIDCSEISTQLIGNQHQHQHIISLSESEHETERNFKNFAPLTESLNCSFYAMSLFFNRSSLWAARN